MFSGGLLGLIDIRSNTVECILIDHSTNKGVKIRNTACKQIQNLKVERLHAYSRRERKISRKKRKHLKKKKKKRRR